MAIITLATPGDCKVILEFIRKLAKFEKLQNSVIASEEKLRSTLFGAKPYAEVLFVEHETKKVGFALFFHNYSTFRGQPGIFLEDLFIDPDSRGHGFGKLLLSHIARLAVERGCGRLEWSVLDWNQPAIDFYLKLGAKPMSDWTQFRIDGEDLKNLSG